MFRPKRGKHTVNTRLLGLAVLAVAAIVGLTSVCVAEEPCAQPPACYNQPCGDAIGCAPACVPEHFVFGELLYLRPRNDGVEYAVPSNLVAPLPVVQVGRTGTLNPQFEPGFRIGGGFEFDCCSSISAAFTHYENGANDAISTDTPFVLRSMVRVPASATTAPQWLDATAHGFTKFDIVDIDYRHVFYCTERTKVNYVAGFRYANLRQSFSSVFTPSIQENVDTLINFDGAGIRLGLEGERSAECCNIFVYGKAAVSFLGGEFQANYTQMDATSVLPTADTSWKEARLVSILDCELGLGWQGCDGHVRASAGYMVNGWLNVVKTSEFLSSVQANQYHGANRIDGNALVFDGLVTRLELRW